MASPSSGPSKVRGLLSDYTVLTILHGRYGLEKSCTTTCVYIWGVGKGNWIVFIGKEQHGNPNFTKWAYFQSVSHFHLSVPWEGHIVRALYLLTILLISRNTFGCSSSGLRSLWLQNLYSKTNNINVQTDGDRSLFTCAGGVGDVIFSAWKDSEKLQAWFNYRGGNSKMSFPQRWFNIFMDHTKLSIICALIKVN